MTNKTQWRNRIVSIGEADPFTLQDNPDNWRIHPDFQKETLLKMLEGVGWVSQVVVNQTTGRLVDGHLRVWLARERNEPTIPVTYVELTPEEEALILSVIDPIAGMAIADEDILDEIRETLAQARSSVNEVLEAIAKSREAVAVDVKEERPKMPGNTVFRIGDLTIKIPRDVYLHWKDGMYQNVSMNRKEIMAEIRRRLGL